MVLRFQIRSECAAFTGECGKGTACSKQPRRAGRLVGKGRPRLDETIQRYLFWLGEGDGQCRLRRLISRMVRQGHTDHLLSLQYPGTTSLPDRLVCR